jgi:TIR domain-containing protein
MSGAFETNTRIAMTARRTPEIIALACPLSLAVRIDPALLRRVRLELTPALGPGAESDLWFSPLVGSQGAGGVVLDAEVARILRERLARDQAQLDRAAELLDELHRGESEAVRLEEAITVLALRDGVESAALEERLRPVVRALAEGPADRRMDVARWALRALPRMPAPVLQTEAAALLAVGASACLGGRRVTRLGDRHAPLPEGAPWVIGSVGSNETVRLDVQLHEQAIEFVPPGTDGTGTLELPQTSPLYVELVWDEPEQRVDWTIEVEAGRRFPLPADAQNIRIRTFAGREYAVETGADETLHGEARVSPLLGACVTFDGGVGFFVAPDRVMTDVSVVLPGTPGRPVAMRWEGRELSGSIVATPGRVCLIALDQVVIDAVILEFASARAPLEPGTRWVATTGSLVVAGVIDGTGRAQVESEAGDEPLAGSPVVAGGRVIGQISYPLSGGVFEMNSVAEMVAAMSLATSEPTTRPMVYVSAATDSIEIGSAIVAMLTERGFDPWSNVTSIRLGERSDIERDRALLESDAAVVVLSPAMVRSSWVQHEINVLTWRRRLGPDVQVVPVATEQFGMQGLLPFGLADMQVVFVRDEASDLNRVAEALHDLRGRGGRRGLAWLVETLMATIEPLPVKLLDGLAPGAASPVESAGGETTPLERAMNLIERAARSPREAVDVITTLTRYSPATSSTDLVLALFSLWVDPGAAARLRAVAERETGPRAVCINASQARTVDDYVRRAWLGLDSPPVVVVDVAWATEGVQAIVSSARAALAGAGEQRGALLVLPLRSPDPAVVSELQAAFPENVLVVLCGPDPLDAGWLTSLGLEPLEPPLEKGQEEAVSAARDYLDRERETVTEAPRQEPPKPPPAATISAPDPAEALLSRFAPVLRYDSGERFFADSVALMTDMVSAKGNANVLRRTDGTLIASARPRSGEARLTLEFLETPYPNGMPATQTDYLQITGEDPAKDAATLRSQSEYADVVYGHIVRDSADRVWLQYWFFYYYDDRAFLGLGKHEGDWEMIQLRVGEADVPDVATFAAGRGAQRYEWSALEIRSDGAPVLYIARGSHACYPRPGRHARLPVVADHADGLGREVRPRLEVISDQGWVRWRGRWGATRGRDAQSPRGPAFHVQWRDPAGFHGDDPTWDKTTSSR